MKNPYMANLCQRHVNISWYNTTSFGDATWGPRCDVSPLHCFTHREHAKIHSAFPHVDMDLKENHHLTIHNISFPNTNFHCDRLQFVEQFKPIRPLSDFHHMARHVCGGSE